MTAPNRPLVVLTRDAAGNISWSRALRRRGLSPYSFPCIRTVAAELTPALSHTLQRLPAYSWLVFTSSAGVYHFMSLQSSQNPSPDAAQFPPVAVVGKQTASAATTAGLRVTFRPTIQTADALAEEIPVTPGQTVLLVQSNLASPHVHDTLATRSAIVTNLPLYRTIMLTSRNPAFEQLVTTNRIGHLVFASPSAVTAFLDRLPRDIQSAVSDLPTIAIGPTTATRLRQAEFTRVLVAADPTPKAISNLIV